MPSIIETRSTRFEVGDDGLILGTATKKTHTLEDARENVAALQPAIATDPFRVLVIDMRGVTDYSVDAAKLYGSTPRERNVAALAVVTKGWLGRILGNLVMVVQAPSTPTKLFDTVEAASEWAQQHRARARAA